MAPSPLLLRTSFKLCLRPSLKAELVGFHPLGVVIVDKGRIARLVANAPLFPGGPPMDAESNGPERRPSERPSGGVSVRGFQPGQSGNPGGRPKALREVMELARAKTEAAVETLAGIMTNGSAPPAARVSAATALLDRGWGRPVQGVHHSGAEAGGMLRLVWGDGSTD